MANSDPFYNRKPVPNEFLEAVGDTGLTRQEEFLSRERKLSSEKGDLRKFWNPKGKTGTLDPHYARKPVPDAMIRGVGETGLTAQEEYANREKKMFKDGVDIRRFSTSSTGGMEPLNDPYYGRKPVDKAEIEGVGESGISQAEAYENRENKASLFDLSGDPFQQLSGSGHRGSISMVASAGAADARRRSSAVAPDMARAAANVQRSEQHNNGYNNQDTLPPIESSKGGLIDSSITKPSATENEYNYGSGVGTTTTTTTTTSTTHGHGGNAAGLYHDMTTTDPDSVAPHER